MTSPMPLMTPQPLPRGGVVVKTSAGLLQVGIPPETIKDTMRLPEGVPPVFVVARELFDYDRGVSVAEVEFPIFYHYFIRRSRAVIVASRVPTRFFACAAGAPRCSEAWRGGAASSAGRRRRGTPNGLPGSARRATSPLSVMVACGASGDTLVLPTAIDVLYCGFSTHLYTSKTDVPPGPA